MRFAMAGPRLSDGNDPLCGDFVAWRHPTYGNYTPGELSYEFVAAHDASYSRRVFSGLECLVWLLCDESRWMPDALRETLKRGFRERVFWWVNEISDSSNAVVAALLGRPKERVFLYQNVEGGMDRFMRASAATAGGR